jgi:hypothetical protein
MKIALFAGLALLAAAIGLTVSQSPASVAASNRTPGSVEPLWSTTTGATVCQGEETLPHGTTAIRVWLDAAAGPRVRLVVYSAGREIARGTRGSNWIGGSVTVPVRPLARTVAGVTVCTSFSLRDETVSAQGNATPPAIAAREGQGHPLAGRVWIEYLRPGRRSWASLAPEVITHMGFGRGIEGDWIAYVTLVLVAAVAALSSREVVSGLR